MLISEKDKRFVALDRDGTINVEKRYLSDPDQIELLPGVIEGLHHFKSLGLPIVVITNQSALGRGYFGWSQLNAIHSRLQTLLRREGIRLAGIYVCPHAPWDKCYCRKPATALLERAAQNLGRKSSDAIVIGDKLCDISLGRRARAQSILVRTGYGRNAELDPRCKPDLVCEDLREAAFATDELLECIYEEKQLPYMR